MNTSFTIESPALTLGQIWAAKTPKGPFHRVKIEKRVRTWNNLANNRQRKSHYSVVSTCFGRVFRIAGNATSDCRGIGRGKTIKLGEILGKVVDIQAVNPVIAQYLELEAWIASNLNIPLSGTVIPIYTDVIRKPYLGSKFETASIKRIYRTYLENFRANRAMLGTEGLEVFQERVEDSIQDAVFKFWRKFGPGGIWGPPKFKAQKAEIQFFGVYLTRRPSISNTRGSDLRIYVRRRFVKGSDLGTFKRHAIYSRPMREKLLEKLDLMGGFQKKRLKNEETDRSDTFLGVFGWNFFVRGQK